jgi:hypothetical protein
MARVQAAEHHPSAVISSSSDFLSGGIVGILSFSALLRFNERRSGKLAGNA